MLQLSDSILTQDLLTNNIIIHFVSERLADCVEPLLQYTPKKLKAYFPPRYKSAKMCPAIQDLYNLLKSNSAYIPPLILEYVLATCIHSTLVSQEDAGLPTIKYLSESDYKCICATINNEQPNIHKSELDSILNKIQDITYYKDFCFQNTQFYHLFFMTEHQLYRSGLIIRNGTAPKTDIIYEPGTIQY